MMHKHAKFTSMETSTVADWQIIVQEQRQFSKKLPDRILTHLQLLSGDYGGFPVDRLTHSLQTASLAHEAGESEEYIVCALLHDIGDTLGSLNHADVSAAILQPFVSEEHHWMVKHHAIFQGYYFFHHIGMDRHMREQFRDHPNFEMTVRFCERYDNPAFDPERKAMCLEDFEPMLRNVFKQPRNSLYKVSMEALETTK